MRRSKIKKEEVAGQYHHLGNPSKKIILRAGGVMHSSEDGKPSEDEKGTWSVKNSEIHVSVAGDDFIFEINGDGNLQVVALLNNGFREDAPESTKKGFILKRIISEPMTPKKAKRIFASIGIAILGIVLLAIIIDLISTRIEEGNFLDELLVMAMLPIIGSVIAIWWLFHWGWIADEKVESEESDDELSLPTLVLGWFIKIVIVWPIYWPCWLMYKTVFVAIPTGIVLCVMGAVLGNAHHALVGFLLIFILGSIGLIFRLYVWFIYMRYGDPAEAMVVVTGVEGSEDIAVIAATPAQGLDPPLPSLPPFFPSRSCARFRANDSASYVLPVVSNKGVWITGGLSPPSFPIIGGATTGGASSNCCLRCLRLRLGGRNTFFLSAGSVAEVWRV